jgi:PAS domain S-box-containing protein
MVLTTRSLPARTLSVVCAVLVSTIAALVLLGWGFDIAPLRTGLIGGVLMRPNAAVALILAGAALAVRRRVTARALSAVVLLIGALSLIESAYGRQMIAGLLFGDSALGVQMSMRAALAFTFAGLGGLLIANGTAAQFCGGAAGYLGFAGVVTHLYGAQFAPDSQNTPLASSTAILVTVWSVGFLARTSDDGPIALLLSRGGRGQSVRLMVLISLAAPVALGVLCLAAIRAGWFDSTFALALVVTSAAFTLVFLTMRMVWRVRESETLYRTIVETSQEGIVTVDANLRVTFVNEHFASMLGYRVAELLGRESTILVHEDDRETVRQRITEHRRSSATSHTDLRLLRRDGSLLHAICSASTIRISGAGDGLLIMAVDITDRVAAETTLRRTHEILAARFESLEGAERAAQSTGFALQREEIEALALRLSAATQEIESFSYSVSHDLRAPLRAIDGFSRELQLSYGERLDDRGKQYLGRIRAATQRMSQLIDDLLDLSRLARKPLRREHVDVTVLARAVAAETNGGRIDVEQGLTAEADPALLGVLLANLIGNAVKFSSRRDDPRIEVFSAGDGAIGIRDNGTGFDMQYVDKIFAPFQRLHSSEFEGTGIGLAIVQRIVHRHGGTIRAESAPGRGATFFFTLGGSPA